MVQTIVLFIVELPTCQPVMIVMVHQFGIIRQVHPVVIASSTRKDHVVLEYPTGIVVDLFDMVLIDKL